MLNFSRLINHYSSGITIILFPLVYIVIFSFSGSDYGTALYVVSGICIPVGIALLVIKKKELRFSFYECDQQVSKARLRKTLVEICQHRKWSLTKFNDNKDSDCYFEIKTPIVSFSWGCLITLVPSEHGFYLRCINAVDYPLNQVFFSFGHREKIKAALLNDLHSLMKQV